MKARIDMRKSRVPAAIILSLLILAFAVSVPAKAQIRGLYTPGLNATNSGTQSAPGFTYGNFFLTYSFSELKGPDNEKLPVDGKASILADLNVFAWVSKGKLLGGNVGLVAALSVTNNSLSLARFGSVAGGAGLGDTYAQPFTIGWHEKRYDLQAGYAFVAPTGRFHEHANDNTGAGYWAHAPFAGGTVYLTKNRGAAVSAWQFYEFHTEQKETGIHPGQTLSIDYSLTQTLPLQKDKSFLQVGVVGYGQWQTTDRTGPGLIEVIGKQHYGVNAIGASGNVILPPRKFALGAKYFKEFSARSTVQGYSLQISGALTF